MQTLPSGLFFESHDGVRGVRSLHPSYCSLQVGLALLPGNALHNLKDIVPWLEVAMG